MRQLFLVLALGAVVVTPATARAQESFRCQKIAAGGLVSAGTPAPDEVVCRVSLDAGIHYYRLQWSVISYGVVQVEAAGPNGELLHRLGCYSNGPIDWGCGTESSVPSSYQQPGSILAGWPVGTGQSRVDFILPVEATLTYTFRPITYHHTCLSEDGSACTLVQAAAGTFTLDGI